MTTATPLRLVVVDDSDDLRALLRLAFADDERFEIVAQGADGDEAVELTSRLRPDLLLLDLAMPGTDGLTAIPRVRSAAPETRVVVLSGFENREVARQALERGADAYVEKGTPLTRLLDVAWQICHGEPRAPAAPAGAARSAATARVDGEDSHDVAYELRVESAMRVTRWVAVVFVLLQFLLYEAPPGTALPFDRFLGAGLVAGFVVLLNAMSVMASRAGGAARLRRAGRAVLAGDAAVVLGVVWLFSFDARSALWALLVIPVLEGAMRGQLRGALTTWGVLGLGYVLREAWAAGHYARELEPASIHYRLGIVLLVAVASGHLAHHLHLQSAARDSAARESRRRARLLRVVADASRSMASVDLDKVRLAMVEGARALGFDTAEVCTYDEAGGTWRLEHALGLPVTARAAQPIASGIAGRVWSDRDIVVLRRDDPTGDELVGRGGLGSLAALPVEAGDVLVAALVAGSYDDAPVGEVEVECLGLLTAQAGLAMRNAQFIEEIRGRASHDALTGLPNHILFEDRFQLAMAQAQRMRTKVALLFLDLDRFKAVNDTYGHELGNELLCQVADRLRRALRAGDTVARLSGDEFALALVGGESDDDVTTVVEKLLTSFEAPFRVDGHEIAISPSIGVATYPDDGDDYAGLLRSADLAMYEVKARGRNGYQRAHAPAGDRTKSEARLEADFRRAVRANAIEVAYQPMVSLRTGDVVGVEALARWRHPTLGDVPPARFIPLAESLGLVDAVDARVLDVACRQVAAWNRQRAHPLRLSVNVSALHLETGDIAAAVLRALAASGLDPALLTVELTETVATKHVDATSQALRALKDLSVGLAIDDFGTGYSMLTRVQQYPVDTLKIDRSFVAAARGEDGVRLLDATIELGRRLELNLVVEGVETEEQAVFLRAHGCDLVQGFYFGEPHFAEAVADIVPA